MLLSTMVRYNNGPFSIHGTHRSIATAINTAAVCCMAAVGIEACECKTMTKQWASDSVV